MPPKDTPEFYLNGEPTEEAFEMAKQLQANLKQGQLLPPEASNILFAYNVDEEFITDGK